jgi:hypothetical protein
MHVYGMRSIVARREYPMLNLSERDLKINPIDVIHLAVDFIHAIELKRAFDHRANQPADGGKGSWDEGKHEQMGIYRTGVAKRSE